MYCSFNVFNVLGSIFNIFYKVQQSIDELFRTDVLVMTSSKIKINIISNPSQKHNISHRNVLHTPPFASSLIIIIIVIIIKHRFDVVSLAYYRIVFYVNLIYSFASSSSKI